MPITVEVVGISHPEPIEKVFGYFRAVDERFSTYKDSSEISKINRGEINADAYSAQMREVFAIAEMTKQETDGYFDIELPLASPMAGLRPRDPSGIVKGWAIKNAADLLRADGFKDFYIETGGDIASSGKNSDGKEWSVGIRNPFNRNEIVKIIFPRGAGMATSGSYERGAHIYNPHSPGDKLDEIVSITVIGPDVLEADRFATAAFAMGKTGIEFLEERSNFEAYAIDKNGMATYTSGFDNFTRP